MGNLFAVKKLNSIQFGFGAYVEILRREHGVCVNSPRSFLARRNDYSRKPRQLNETPVYALVLSIQFALSLICDFIQMLLVHAVYACRLLANHIVKLRVPRFFNIVEVFSSPAFIRVNLCSSYNF